VNQSYNEVEALVKRAARGVNQPWGMADESAKATRWLAERGFAGPDIMVQLLDLYDSNVPAKPIIIHDHDHDHDHWHAAGGVLLCPVITGTALSDFSYLLASTECIRCSNIACPLMLLPFAAQASLSIQACLSISWDSARFIVEGSRVASQIEMARDNQSMDIYTRETASVVVQPSLTSLDEHLMSEPSLYESNRVERAWVDEQCWKRLSSFAQRTYAPASDESRRLGAGAGDSDND